MLKELNTSCKTLVYWQEQKDTGNKLASQKIPIWADIVTKQLAQLKAKIAQMNLEQFLSHNEDLIKSNIDTSYIYKVQIVANKPDFNAYSKLKQQLQLYRDSNDYQLKQAGLQATIAVETRTSQHKIKAIEAHRKGIILGHTTQQSATKETYVKDTDNYYTKALLNKSRDVQQSIDTENTAILLARVARKKKQAYKAQQTQAQKFIRNAVKQYETMEK
jgi:hypothetical protein